MKRYFEFVEGNSSKFWEITVRNNNVTVRFGRIGTEGQIQAKALAERRCRHEACPETDRLQAKERVSGDGRPLRPTFVVDYRKPLGPADYRTSGAADRIAFGNPYSLG